MAGTKEIGFEQDRNNKIGKNGTQNRVSEIWSVNSHLETWSVNLTEISRIKAGNVLCRNLISKYYMSKFDQQILYVKIWSANILCRNLISKYYMSKFDQQIFYVKIWSANIIWAPLSNLGRSIIFPEIWSDPFKFRHIIFADSNFRGISCLPRPRCGTPLSLPGAIENK